MLQEKQFFLKLIADGITNHRRISNRISDRFSMSPAAIKNALLREGYIQLDYVKREGATQKLNYYYKLTEKQLCPDEPVKPVKVEPKFQYQWEDGTPKSSGNAFDWKSSAKGMFDKREIARMTQNYTNNYPITIYSRA